jgi:hypothetical protein
MEHTAYDFKHTVMKMASFCYSNKFDSNNTKLNQFPS